MCRFFPFRLCKPPGFETLLPCCLLLNWFPDHCASSFKKLECNRVTRNRMEAHLHKIVWTIGFIHLKGVEQCRKRRPWKERRRTSAKEKRHRLRLVNSSARKWSISG